MLRGHCCTRSSWRGQARSQGAGAGIGVPAGAPLSRPGVRLRARTPCAPAEPWGPPTAPASSSRPGPALVGGAASPRGRGPPAAAALQPCPPGPSSAFHPRPRRAAPLRPARSRARMLALSPAVRAGPRLPAGVAGWGCGQPSRAWGHSGACYPGARLQPVRPARPGPAQLPFSAACCAGEVAGLRGAATLPGPSLGDSGRPATLGGGHQRGTRGWRGSQEPPSSPRPPSPPPHPDAAFSQRLLGRPSHPHLGGGRPSTDLLAPFCKVLLCSLPPSPQ